MTITTNETETFEIIACCVCGTRFGVSQVVIESKRQNSGSIYCPNGHSIGWAKSEADRLRELLVTKQKEVTAARCESMAEKQRREQVEAELARHKSRAKNGVCPCCNRSFINLQRHMATKHPKFT